jgi:CubicO group peptidase (beta-lactamase class C family)
MNQGYISVERRITAARTSAGLGRMWLVYAVAGLLAGSGSAAAQSLPRGTPDMVSMSGERLARFDSAAAAYVREGRVAGIVALVLRQGQVVYESSHGVMDIASAAPMRRDAMFRIASMTKPVTSVAVMMLVEEGRLSLSDPVGRYIPAFERTMVAVQDGDSVRIVPAEKPITILHLLTHTAGIPYPDEQMHEALRVRYRDSSLRSSWRNSGRTDKSI